MMGRFRQGALAAPKQESAMTNPTERFSNRVENYVLARPSYPLAVIDLLAERCGLGPQAAVADVGAGTGILTALLLERAGYVFAVEPNANMRRVAEDAFAGNPAFSSVAATAEATTLPDRSIDLITAGQAFHWFEPAQTRREFARILRPGGWVALVWNDRRTAGAPFLEAYDRLLRDHAVDYANVKHKRFTPAALEAFFGGPHLQRASFPYAQILDLQGLERRLLSSSYTPAPGQPGHEAMLQALAALFARHQRDGAVQIDYDSTVFYGRIEG
jgi:SAM-dependent methyltransferase